jgi:hypothetical protein
MRPKNVIYFEWLTIISTAALGAVNDYFSWSDLRASVGDLSPVAIIISQVVLASLIIGLALLTSRRRGKIAMWVFIVLCAIGAPMSIHDDVIGAFPSPSSFVTALQVIGQVLAIVLLFTPSARHWINRRPDSKAQVEIFS